MSKPWEWTTSNCESVESYYPCPIDDCIKHSQSNRIKWTHINCGGYFRLYENGKEKCQKCGVEFLFCNNNYNCGTKFSYHKVRAILQFLVGLNDDNVSDDFWFNLKESLKYQMDNYPSKFI